MKRIKNAKGITLIALVITIIVLLILAAITLNTLAGRRGIIRQAQNAETEHNRATALEDITIVTYQSLDNKGYTDTVKLEQGLNDIGATIKSKTETKWTVSLNGYEFEIDIEEGNVKDIDKEELVDKRLITKWNVAAGETIDIRVYYDSYGATNVNFTIDWGDGTVEDITKENIILDEWGTGRISHTYAEAGEKNVIIDGTCEAFNVQGSIISVENWGETGLKKINFYHCKNLTTIASPSKNTFANIHEEGFAGAFIGTELQTIPEDLFSGCSNVTSFDKTFSSCDNLTSIPPTLFDDCINATFEMTFHGCYNLTGNPIELWGEHWISTSETSGGAGCYDGCTKLNGYENIPEYWRQIGK